MASIDDLKNLSPEERIRKLKELEEERKREIEEAETLIGESERELGEIEEKKNLPIDQLKATNIEQLFTREEKRMFATKRFVNMNETNPLESASAEGVGSLEETAEAESESESAKKGAEFKGYGAAMERAKSEQDPMEAYKSKTVTGAKEEEDAYRHQKTVTGAHEEKAVYDQQKTVTGTYK